MQHANRIPVRERLVDAAAGGAGGHHSQGKLGRKSKKKKTKPTTLKSRDFFFVKTWATPEGELGNLNTPASRSLWSIKGPWAPGMTKNMRQHCLEELSWNCCFPAPETFNYLLWSIYWLRGHITQTLNTFHRHWQVRNFLWALNKVVHAWEKVKWHRIYFWTSLTCLKDSILSVAARLVTS